MWNRKQTYLKVQKPLHGKYFWGLADKCPIHREDNKFIWVFWSLHMLCGTGSCRFLHFLKQARLLNSDQFIIGSNYRIQCMHIIGTERALTGICQFLKFRQGHFYLKRLSSFQLFIQQIVNPNHVPSPPSLSQEDQHWGTDTTSATNSKTGG